MDKAKGIDFTGYTVEGYRLKKGSLKGEYILTVHIYKKGVKYVKSKEILLR